MCIGASHFIGRGAEGRRCYCQDSTWFDFGALQFKQEGFLKTIGVLALQGDFEAHRKALEEAAGADAPVRVIEVRTAVQLALCDGLIIPGGESTTMMKLLGEENLLDPIRRFGSHKAIYGTCAGAILLARDVSHPAQASLGLLDIDIERNAYGRQVDSHIGRLAYDGGDMEAVFIRAPIVRRVGAGGRVVAIHRGDPVWIEQGRHMITTFHPELGPDRSVHRRFLTKL
jgi:5'-phosphate synthase pdxT subunit